MILSNNNRMPQLCFVLKRLIGLLRGDRRVHHRTHNSIEFIWANSSGSIFNYQGICAEGHSDERGPQTKCQVAVHIRIGDEFRCTAREISKNIPAMLSIQLPSDGDARKLFVIS